MKAVVVSTQVGVDKDGVFRHLEVHRDLDSNETKAYDILPAKKAKLAAKGIGDFQFEHNGKKYEDCKNPDDLLWELHYCNYRTVEARKLIEQLLVEKFGYKWFHYSSERKSLISTKEYKANMKKQTLRDALITKVNSGEEITIRFTMEINHNQTDGYHACWCTNKDARGVCIDVKFADNIKLKPYPNHKEYFHVLDENGDVLKTRTKYCAITGHVEMDENGIPTNQFIDAWNRITIIVDTIKAA